MKRVKFLSLALAFCLASFFASSALYADWADNFNGGFQQSWAFSSQNGAGAPGGNLSATINNGTLLMQDATNLASGGSATGIGVVQSQSFNDVRVTGLMNPLGESDTNGELGLLARGNLAVGNSYFLNLVYVNNAAPEGTLELIKITGGAASVLNSQSIAGFQVNTPVFLQFDLIGTSLTGQAFTAAGGSLLATVSATDNAFSSGNSGVLTVVDGAAVTETLRGRYDNVASTAIPEPSAAVICFVGMVVGLAKRRRTS